MERRRSIAEIIANAIRFKKDRENLNDLIGYCRCEGLTDYAETLERIREYIEDYHWLGKV